jgi:LPXTG-motif cell wall-anchored protein
VKKPALLVAATAVALLTVGTGASSASTFSVDEPFSTLGALTSPWVASGVPAAPEVVAAVGDTPENALRLTSNARNERGFVLYAQAIPLAAGIDVSFHQAQFGGNGADGLVFFVKDAADASTTPGSSGGSLGYSIGRSWGAPSIEGISGALLGVGLDGFGNFDSPESDGAGCARDEHVRSREQNTISLRGPGQGFDGYCLLADVVSLSASSLDPLSSGYTTRVEADRLIRVVVDPATATAPMITIYYEGTQVIQVALPSAFAGVSAANIGFSAGTGGYYDFHDVWELTTTEAVVAPVDSSGDGSGDGSGDTTGDTSGDTNVADPALATTGPDQTGIIASGLGGLLLLAVGVVTMRRRHKA